MEPHFLLKPKCDIRTALDVLGVPYEVEKDWPLFAGTLVKVEPLKAPAGRIFHFPMRPYRKMREES